MAHGIDINQKVVDTINIGKIHIVELSLDLTMVSAVTEGCLNLQLHLKGKCT